MNDIEVKSKGAEKSQPLLMWAVFFLIIGGLVGWTLGRQAAPSSPQANSPITVNDNTLAAATTPGSETAVTNNLAPTTGPTPASITSETIKTLGNPDAPVTVVEFSDYQCPFCLRNFQETFPQLKAEFIDTGRVFYVFKDFPIASLHPLAYRLHEAALCAGESGESVAYWQAHDLFFSKSQTFKLNSLAEMDAVILAEFETAGLSTEGLSECLQSNRHAVAVQAGIAEGQSLGVSGTPTFFINGYPIVGAQPYQVFQQAIMLAEEGRLAAEFAASTAPTSVPPAQPATVPLSDEPAKGDPNAPVTIVEYSDYQCPFCLRHFNNTMPSLL